MLIFSVTFKEVKIVHYDVHKFCHFVYKVTVPAILYNNKLMLLLSS